jgi:hypothetical protein
VAWLHRAERDLDRPSLHAAFRHPVLGRADHVTVSASAEVSREFVGRLADTDWPAGEVRVAGLGPPGDEVLGIFVG